MRIDKVGRRLVADGVREIAIFDRVSIARGKLPPRAKIGTSLEGVAPG